MTEIARKWKAKSDDQKQLWHQKLEEEKAKYRHYLEGLPLDERCVSLSFF